MIEVEKELGPNWVLKAEIRKQLSPLKIYSYSTLFSLLQHLEPMIEYFCSNAKFLQYVERQRSIVVKSIGNLQKSRSAVDQDMLQHTLVSCLMCTTVSCHV